MGTHSTTEQMEFQQLGRRRVIERFDGGKISSDAGGLLLREVESQLYILKRLARDCFRDYRDKDRIEHTVGSLIRQRVYGIALGYEDLNDHDSLRHDVVMVSRPTRFGTHRLRMGDPLGFPSGTWRPNTPPRLGLITLFLFPARSTQRGRLRRLRSRRRRPVQFRVWKRLRLNDVPLRPPREDQPVPLAEVHAGCLRAAPVIL